MVHGDTLSSKLINYILIGVVLFSIIIILIGIMMGRSQDEGFLKNYQAFIKVDNLVESGQASEAKNILNDLIQKTPSYSLYWKYAWVAGSEGNYNLSLKYLQKTRELNPFIIGDQKYLYSFGVNLFLVGDYARAKVYFAKAIELNTDVRLSNQCKAYVKEIDKKI